MSAKYQTLLGVELNLNLVVGENVLVLRVCTDSKNFKTEQTVKTLNIKSLKMKHYLNTFNIIV